MVPKPMGSMHPNTFSPSQRNSIPSCLSVCLPDNIKWNINRWPCSRGRDRAWRRRTKRGKKRRKRRREGEGGNVKTVNEASVANSQYCWAASHRSPYRRRRRRKKTNLNWQKKRGKQNRNSLFPEQAKLIQAYILRSRSSSSSNYQVGELLAWSVVYKK